MVARHARSRQFRHSRRGIHPPRRGHGPQRVQRRRRHRRRCPYRPRHVTPAPPVNFVATRRRSAIAASLGAGGPMVTVDSGNQTGSRRQRPRRWLAPHPCHGPESARTQGCELSSYLAFLIKLNGIFSSSRAIPPCRFMRWLAQFTPNCRIRRAGTHDDSTKPFHLPSPVTVQGPSPPTPRHTPAKLGEGP
jgi:hypothetical protein